MKIETIVDCALARHGIIELSPEAYAEIACSECGEPKDCCSCWCYYHADEVDTAAVPCAKCYCEECGKPKLSISAQERALCSCHSFQLSPRAALREGRSLAAHPEVS